MMLYFYGLLKDTKRIVPKVSKVEYIFLSPSIGDQKSVSTKRTKEPRIHDIFYVKKELDSLY